MTATSSTAKRVLVTLTLMSAGRAMTLWWIGRAGDGGAGDPPAAWLMPLVGDAVVGTAAIVVAALLLWRPTFSTWVIAMVWTSVAAFDALAAFVVDVQSPWPDFFMLEVFGRSMFFAAAAMHVVIAALLGRPDVRLSYGVAVEATDATAEARDRGLNAT